MPAPGQILLHPRHGPVYVVSYTGSVDGRISNWVDFIPLNRNSTSTVISSRQSKGDNWREDWEDITDEYQVVVSRKDGKR